MELRLTPKSSFGLTTLLAFGLATVFFVSCQPGSTHPNQIDAFDSDTYNALTTAHAALLSLRNPNYKNDFNVAASSYQSVFQSYSLYRSTPLPATESKIAPQLIGLANSIQALENAIQRDLPVSPQAREHAEQKALAKRQKYARVSSPASLSLTDILTILQIGAGVAVNIPAASPYAGIAQAVSQAAQLAIEALSSQAGAPIDLSTIQPVPLLP